MREGRKPEYIGSYNKNLVLEILIKTGPKSRAELARISKLTKTAISEIVDELIRKRVLIEIGKVETSRGRRPTKLTINPDLKVLAVDLSGLEGRAGIVNACGEIEEDYYLLVKDLNDICNLINPLFEKYKKHIIAISLSVPGIIDKHTGEVVLSVGLNWKNFNLKGFLTDRYKDIPISIEKDTNNGLLSEIWFGEGKKFNTLFYLLLEKGIGLGIYHKGEILEGFRGIEGEIGHTIISKNDNETCWCGNTGCLETIASIPKILEKAGYSPNYIEHVLRDFVENKNNKVLETVFDYLGISLANAIHILAPEAVCISGNRGITKDALKLLSDLLKREANKYLFDHLKNKIHFYPSPLGNNGLLIGAGVLGFISYFKDI